MATRQDIENLRHDYKDLCKLAEMLGYRTSPFGQLQCDNGAFVSSLLEFFEDNPGACEAVIEWVLERGAHRDGDAIEDTHDHDLECPGCGCMPGDGKTLGCDDPMGCGFTG